MDTLRLSPPCLGGLWAGERKRAATGACVLGTSHRCFARAVPGWAGASGFLALSPVVPHLQPRPDPASQLTLPLAPAQP